MGRRRHYVRTVVRPSVPAALGGIVQPVGNLTIFTPAYGPGLDGTGQSIAVAGHRRRGHSSYFQAAAGVRAHDPVQILVPTTVAATVVSGDESDARALFQAAGSCTNSVVIAICGCSER